MYHVQADFAEGEDGAVVSAELLAIRFGSSENANKFKAMFEKCQGINKAVADGEEPEHVEPLKDEKPDEASDAAKKAAASTAEESKEKTAA